MHENYENTKKMWFDRPGFFICQVDTMKMFAYTVKLLDSIFGEGVQIFWRMFGNLLENVWKCFGNVCIYHQTKSWPVGTFFEREWPRVVE